MAQPNHQFFHVDRLRRLVLGASIETEHLPCKGIDGLEAFAEAMFPDGATWHGHLHFLAGDATDNDARIELVWELARRLYNPEAPSRLTAIFGWDSLDNARQFRDSMEPSGGAIWRLESAMAPFRCDMNLLRLADAPVVVAMLAQRYWAGQRIEEIEPRWELLVAAPATVVELIE